MQDDIQSSKWWDRSWLPVTGCSKISEGCQKCWAHISHQRFRAIHGAPKFSTIIYHPERLDAPLHWRKPRRIHVGSMTDMFHEKVKNEWLNRIMEIIARLPQHTFMFLTKRPVEMDSYFRYRYYGPIKRPPLPNVWLGVTAENQRRADERIPVLLGIPAAKRFVSFEPLLEQITLHEDWLDGISWAIVGAETGPGKRIMEEWWSKDLAEQCHAAGIPFFFKKNSAGGSTLDGRVYEEVPR